MEELGIRDERPREALEAKKEARGASVAVTHLYGIRAGHHDGTGAWHPARVVAFPVTRVTPRRIYYRPDGPECVGERFVDRRILERDGRVTRRSGRWWETDLTVHLHPPEVPERPPHRDLVALRAAMIAAHPDRGGSHEAFLSARREYESVRDSGR